MKACGGTLRGSRPGRHPPDLLPQAGGLHRDHPIHAKLPTPWRHSPRCVDDPRPIARTEGWGGPSKSGLPINLQSSDSWRRGQSRGPLGGARTPNPSLAGSIPAPRAIDEREALRRRAHRSVWRRSGFGRADGVRLGDSRPGDKARLYVELMAIRVGWSMPAVRQEGRVRPTSSQAEARVWPPKQCERGGCGTLAYHSAGALVFTSVLGAGQREDAVDVADASRFGRRGVWSLRDREVRAPADQALRGP